MKSSYRHHHHPHQNCQRHTCSKPSWTFIFTMIGKSSPTAERTERSTRIGNLNRRGEPGHATKKRAKPKQLTASCPPRRCFGRTLVDSRCCRQTRPFVGWCTGTETATKDTRDRHGAPHSRRHTPGPAPPPTQRRWRCDPCQHHSFLPGNLGLSKSRGSKR